MKLRYIALKADYLTLGDSFSSKFISNARFISNYLSLGIRKCDFLTDGTYNMIDVSITKGNHNCQIESDEVLKSYIHVSEENIRRYLNMYDEIIRFEYYLEILERGYMLAAEVKGIPMKELLDLHQKFREGGYVNTRLFKKKAIKEYGIKVVLNHCFSSYDYRLVLSVYDKSNQLIAEDYILRTYPDEICFSKDVRQLVITDRSLQIIDFLGRPFLECQLADLANGIISSVCLNEDIKKGIYSEDAKAEIDALKWDTTGDMTKNTIKP